MYVSYYLWCGYGNLIFILDPTIGHFTTEQTIHNLGFKMVGKVGHVLVSYRGEFLQTTLIHFFLLQNSLFFNAFCLSF